MAWMALLLFGGLGSTAFTGGVLWGAWRCVRRRHRLRTQDPARAQVDSVSQVWLGPVALGVGGLVLLVFGIGSFALGRESDALLEHVDKRAAATEEQLRSLQQQSHPDINSNDFGSAASTGRR